MLSFLIFSLSLRTLLEPFISQNNYNFSQKGSAENKPFPSALPVLAPYCYKTSLVLYMIHTVKTLNTYKANPECVRYPEASWSMAVTQLNTGKQPEIRGHNLGFTFLLHLTVDTLSLGFSLSLALSWTLTEEGALGFGYYQLKVPHPSFHRSCVWMTITTALNFIKSILDGPGRTQWQCSPWRSKYLSTDWIDLRGATGVRSHSTAMTNPKTTSISSASAPTCPRVGPANNHNPSDRNQASAKIHDLITVLLQWLSPWITMDRIPGFPVIKCCKTVFIHLMLS